MSGAASGHDAILVAVIAAAGSLAAVVIGPFVTEYVRSHRRPPVDHRNELIDEQAALIEHLTAELATYRDKRRRDR